MDELLQEVERLFAAGATFEEVEDRIERSGRADETKAAAWLYAWSFQSCGEAAYMARQAELLLRPDRSVPGSD